MRIIGASGMVHGLLGGKRGSRSIYEFCFAWDAADALGATGLNSFSAFSRTFCAATNTVQSLVSSLGSAGVDAYVNFLMDAFSKPPSTLPADISLEYVPETEYVCSPRWGMVYARLAVVGPLEL